MREPERGPAQSIQGQSLDPHVGGRDVGATGPADTLVKGISLKPADLVARAEGSGGTATVPLPKAKGAPERP